MLVALGATAAASLFGRGFRLTQHRSELLSWPPREGDFAGDGTPLDAALASIHPSAVLRSDQPEEDFAGLVADLRIAARGLTA